EEKANCNAHHLIGQQKEQRRDQDHDEHHDGGDGGLLARRPGDLLHFRPHFLQELEWTDFRHRVIQQPSPPNLQGRDRPAVPFWGIGSPRKSDERAADDSCYLLPLRRIVKRDPLYPRGPALMARHSAWQEWRDSNPQPPVLEGGKHSLA